MVMQPLPQQILIAQANALGLGERSLPLALPPISQSLISIANALPLAALPALPGPGGTGVFPFPTIPPLTAAYQQAAPGARRPAASPARPPPFGRPGVMRALPQRIRSGLS
jgi:hypothetical protein